MIEHNSKLAGKCKCDKCKEYRKNWMRRWRTNIGNNKMKLKRLANNQCPECGIFLTEENDKYHECCPYYKIIHENLDNKSQLL
jgi:hypothetical protein